MINAALVTGLVSAVAALGLQGLDLLDLPPASLLTAAPWKAAAATSLFQSLLIAMLAMTRPSPTSSARAFCRVPCATRRWALNVTAGPDPRDWRSLPADTHDYTVGLEDGVRGLRIGLSLDFGHVKATRKSAPWFAAAAQRFEELGAHVEDVGPLIEPLQNFFEPLWIGSFATRLRQIPTQLHGKLDPGFRAAAEKGLAITLADYARPTRRSPSSRAIWRFGTRPSTCCSRP